MTRSEPQEPTTEPEGPIVFSNTWDGGMVGGWWQVRRTPEGYVVEEDEEGVISGPHETLEEAIRYENLLSVSSATSSISFEEGAVEDIRSKLRFDSSVEPGYFLRINGESWTPDERTIRWQRMGNPGFGTSDALERIRARMERLQERLASLEASRDQVEAQADSGSGFTLRMHPAAEEQLRQIRAGLDEALDLMTAVKRARGRDELEAVLRGGEPDGPAPHSLARELLDELEERGWREDP